MEIENPERVKEIKKQSLLLEKDELLEEYKQKCLSFFEENSYGLPWIQISNWANLDNEISGIQKLIAEETIQTIDELQACMSEHSRNMIDNWIKVIGKFYLKFENNIQTTNETLDAELGKLTIVKQADNHYAKDDLEKILTLLNRSFQDIRLIVNEEFDSLYRMTGNTTNLDAESYYQKK